MPPPISADKGPAQRTSICTEIEAGGHDVWKCATVRYLYLVVIVVVESGRVGASAIADYLWAMRDVNCVKGGSRPST